MHKTLPADGEHTMTDGSVRTGQSTLLRSKKFANNNMPRPRLKFKANISPEDIAYAAYMLKDLAQFKITPDLSDDELRKNFNTFKEAAQKMMVGDNSPNQEAYAATVRSFTTAYNSFMEWRRLPVSSRRGIMFELAQKTLRYAEEIRAERPKLSEKKAMSEAAQQAWSHFFREDIERVADKNRRADALRFAFQVIPGFPKTADNPGTSRAEAEAIYVLLCEKMSDDRLKPDQARRLMNENMAVLRDYFAGKYDDVVALAEKGLSTTDYKNAANMKSLLAAGKSSTPPTQPIAPVKAPELIVVPDAFAAAADGVGSSQSWQEEKLDILPAFIAAQSMASPEASVVYAPAPVVLLHAQNRTAPKAETTVIHVAPQEKGSFAPIRSTPSSARAVRRPNNYRDVMRPVETKSFLSHIGSRIGAFFQAPKSEVLHGPVKPIEGYIEALVQRNPRLTRESLLSKIGQWKLPRLDFGGSLAVVIGLTFVGVAVFDSYAPSTSTTDTSVTQTATSHNVGDGQSSLRTFQTAAVSMTQNVPQAAAPQAPASVQYAQLAHGAMLNLHVIPEAHSTIKAVMTKGEVLEVVGSAKGEKGWVKLRTQHGLELYADRHYLRTVHVSAPSLN